MAQYLPNDSSENRKKKSKKPHFVNVFAGEGQSDSCVKLPGRHKCECEAAIHNLVSNCLNCGRIVCDQESSGPCFFCGRLVCTDKEQDILNRGSKKSDELRAKLMKTGLKLDDFDVEPSFASIGENLQKAVETRNKMLDFDANSERKTQVIDDQADYFNEETNPYLSEEQRKAIRVRKNELLSKKFGPQAQTSMMTFDFLGRKVVQDQQNAVDFENDPILQSIFRQTVALNIQETLPTAKSIHHHPKYCSSSPVDSKHVDFPCETRQIGSRIIQEAEFAEMSPGHGKCLSIQQPYASLLIKGIKKHEGRDWNTDHRGLLWIASTSKTATKSEITAVENVYRAISNGTIGTASFPLQYKTGALLGCVEVIDCLPQEQYRIEYPNGEIEDSFVIICENPRQLPVHLPIKGKPKLFNLDANIHSTARKMILKQ